MTGLIVLFGYVLLFVLCFFVVRALLSRTQQRTGFNALKTVTFGDESTVVPSRAASILSLLVIFVIWGMFTNSKIVPIHVPGPFMGEAQFSYVAQTADGQRDEAVIKVLVHQQGETVDKPEIEEGTGFARNDSYKMQVWRSGLLRVQKNDEGGEQEGYSIVQVAGQDIAPGASVHTEFGRVAMTSKGTLNFTPKTGLQMQELYLPAPETIVFTFIKLAREGYKNRPLHEHLGISLFRVITGLLLGCIVGIPLGYAMGLSGWFRGWFDPIVEFMRPVPPLALIPLVIIWFGIGETGKIFLLFLAALWIMAIAARAGVSGVNISKINAAYSLGASRRQIMQHVIVPNSLPEIFTGARVAMGVCWGTVVASELVAAQSGIGMMIMNASRFQQTDIVIVGIILIGIIGFAIDVLMRKTEVYLVPWKGRS